MDTKPYLVTENFFPKEEHFLEVLNMLIDSSEMIKEQDGILMHLILKPEQKNGPITGIGLWKSREKFTSFIKSEHSQKIMKTGIAEKMKNYTTDIKASLYTVEHGWHAESHD
jgi:heme-degrading monooxygenase HmoA